MTLAASDTSKWRFVVPYFLSSGVIKPEGRIKVGKKRVTDPLVTQRNVIPLSVALSEKLRALLFQLTNLSRTAICAFYPGLCSILWLPKWSADRLIQNSVSLSNVWYQSCLSPARKEFLQQFRIKHFEKPSLFHSKQQLIQDLLSTISLLAMMLLHFMSFEWQQMNQTWEKNLLKERLKTKWQLKKENKSNTARNSKTTNTSCQLQERGCGASSLEDWK